MAFSLNFNCCHTWALIWELTSDNISVFYLGSAHTVLASYWSSRLQKNDLYGKLGVHYRVPSLSSILYPHPPWLYPTRQKREPTENVRQVWWIWSICNLSARTSCEKYFSTRLMSTVLDITEVSLKHQAGAPNHNFWKISVRKHDLRYRIFETFVVKFLAWSACL